MARTPTPWIDAGDRVLANDDRSTIVCHVTGAITNPATKADTAFIVRAVNAFEANEALIKELVEALRKAQTFIANGRALGFIRMPDAETPDPAHETPSIIDATLRKAEARS